MRKYISDYKLELGIPEWVDTDTHETLVDHYEHDKAEAWVEMHENPDTLEDFYIAFDPVQSGDEMDDVICASTDFVECCEAVAKRFGYTGDWCNFEEMN